jgi:hypothetical protein
MLHDYPYDLQGYHSHFENPKIYYEVIVLGFPHFLRFCQ